MDGEQGGTSCRLRGLRATTRFIARIKNRDFRQRICRRKPLVVEVERGVYAIDQHSENRSVKQARRSRLAARPDPWSRANSHRYIKAIKEGAIENHLGHGQMAEARRGLWPWSRNCRVEDRRGEHSDRRDNNDAGGQWKGPE